MRLLFVHDRFGALGGAEANVLLTATELKRRGHGLALLHGTRTGRDEPAWEGLFPDRYPAPIDRPAAFLAQVLAESRPDAIFLHKLGNLKLMEALAGCGVPVVRMVHDHELYCLRGYKYNPLSRRICTRSASGYCVFPCGATIARDRHGGFPLRWVSYRNRQRELAINRRFSRLVVASEFMRGELVRNGFAPAQIEIHPPVPRPAAEDIACSFDERNRLVYAGQVIRGKGVDVLLESLARVRVPFECVIVGDGSHRRTCERIAARLRLSDRVRFTGWVPQPEIAYFYRDASVAVMSSLWPEPFGATGLEAMRCGLPVVAFDAGGIREWLIDGWNGFLVPWMDRAAYAARIDQLLADKLLARSLGAHAREWVGRRFSFSQYVDGLEHLFSRVGGGRDSHSAAEDSTPESPSPAPVAAASA